MGFLRRHRVILVSALAVGGLVLLGFWAMRPQVVDAPASAASAAPPDDAPADAQPPASAESPTKPAASSADSSVGTFRGRVIDAVTRQPVREFELEFYPGGNRGFASPTPGARTFRTEDGRFEWPNVGADVWRITVSARGYQRAELNNLQIPAGEATAEVLVPLKAGHKITGRVYDATSGVGIAAASISFRDSRLDEFEGNWRIRVRVTSEKDGSFVLDGVPPGRMALAVSARDYAERRLEVVSAANMLPLEIAMSTGGTLAGYLAAADGVTPVQGYVGLFRVGANFGGSARTDEAGTFSYSNLPAGRYRLTGQAESGGTVEREIALGENERITGIVLTLSTGHTIRGMVTGLRPEDFERVSVSVRPEGGDASSSLAAPDVPVDGRGAYLVHGVRPGRVRVSADFSQHRQISRVVEMPAEGNLTVNLDFPRGARLSGHVTRNGKALAGVSVDPQPLVERQDFFHYGGSANEKGEYLLEGLPTGEYTIVVGDAFRSRPVQVAADTEFNIDVPDEQLAGRVVEEGGKALPVTGAEVTLWPAQPGASWMRLRDRADNFGKFSLLGLEPGEFVLSVYKPEYEMYRERISWRAPVPDMTIRLRQDRGVEARVRTGANAAVPRTLHVNEKIGDRTGTMLRLPVDENGVAYIPGALAGSTLSFSASGYEPIVRSWSGQRLDLDLQPRKRD